MFLQESIQINYTPFGSISLGECFWHNNILYITSEFDGMEVGINLATGKAKEFAGSTNVILEPNATVCHPTPPEKQTLSAKGKPNRHRIEDEDDDDDDC